MLASADPFRKPPVFYFDSAASASAAAMALQHFETNNETYCHGLLLFSFRSHFQVQLSLIKE
jgi:hypothetical protein